MYRTNVTDRNKFISIMNEKGIQVGIHYNALHLVDCYKKRFWHFNLSLPKSEIESETTISIPYHELLTDREIEYVIKEMKQYL